MDYEVKSWHVTTFLDIDAMDAGDLPPFKVEIDSLDQATDVKDLVSNTPRGQDVRDSEQMMEVLKNSSGFETEQIFLFPNAQEAVKALFEAVMAESASQATDVFWKEARVPEFGSAPQDWVKL